MKFESNKRALLAKGSTFDYPHPLIHPLSIPIYPVQGCRGIKHTPAHIGREARYTPWTRQVSADYVHVSDL